MNVYALVRTREKAENIFQNLLNDKHLNLIVQDVAEPIHIEKQIDYVIQTTVADLSVFDKTAGEKAIADIRKAVDEVLAE